MIIINGAYGKRMGTICNTAGIDCAALEFPEDTVPEIPRIAQTLAADPAITNVAVVHCETTTGIMNPINEIGAAPARIETRPQYIPDETTGEMLEIPCEAPVWVDPVAGPRERQAAQTAREVLKWSLD